MAARASVPEDFVAGLEGVVAFTSDIAEPDKDGGALRYRGVDIEELVEKGVTFGDVWALLVDGEFGRGLYPAEPFPLPIHTGDVRVDVQAGLAMLAPIWGFRPLLDIDDATARDNLARAAVMALSYVAQSARGIYQPAVPQQRIDEASTVTERFMVRWKGDPDPKHVEAIDAYWVSAAEHGMNASTFTARVIASTGADAAASLSGAVGAMSGPLHGGANEAVLRMLTEIGSKDRVGEFIEGVKAGNARLMGFGHRVYKNYDPRARIIKKACEDVFEVTGVNPLLQIALELEKVALEDEYFVSRRLYPNVDFYSGLIYEALKFPPEMFTVLFAVPRTAGWCAQWLEGVTDPEQKIMRPRQIYTGYREREFVPVDQR